MLSSSIEICESDYYARKTEFILRIYRKKILDTKKLLFSVTEGRDFFDFIEMFM